MNHDGRTNGLTAPSSLSQQHLVEASSAGGAPPGRRPVRARAQRGLAARRSGRGASASRRLPRRAGRAAMVRARLDQAADRHTFAASGVVSLIAMCLAMKHGTIPATPQLSPGERVHHRHRAQPFFMSDAERPWIGSGPERRRRGLVGATGMSGTNVFALIEARAEPTSDAQPQRAAGAADRALIALSAKSDALRQYAQRLRAHLVSTRLSDLRVAYTLQTGREAMPCRLAIVAPSVGALHRAARRGPRRCWRSPLPLSGRARSGLQRLRAPRRLERRRRPAARRRVRLGSGHTVLDAAALTRRRSRRGLSGAPTYPFARRSVSRGEQGGAPEAPAPPAQTAGRRAWRQGRRAWRQGRRVLHVRCAAPIGRLPGRST